MNEDDNSKKKEIVGKKFTYDYVNYEFFGLPDEHIYKQIPWYEEKLLYYIRDLNLEGVYIDVGGNIGNHSLYFLNHCNSTELFVFEPEPFCYDILNKNLKSNSTKQYYLYNIALWSKKTNLKLIRFDTFNNTGLSKVIETDNNDADIKADSLDNTIPSDKKIVLIKIDAESSEPKVLKGGMDIIKSNNPVIICEASTKEEFEEINDILLPLGYKTPKQKFNRTPTYIWSPQ